MRRIGIDVGGTNTDAVLIEDGKVAGALKAPTSEDVTTGILESLKGLGATGLLKGKKIDGVMIGTTHFINAVVQRRHLTKVGALRLGMPASASLPPFCDWPEDLAELVRGGVWMVEGGHEFDGRPFMPLDEAAVTKAAQEMKAKGLKSVAISSIFSPLDPSHEKRAAELVAAVIPDAVITCSSDLGRIGLLERENAGLLNAGLADLSRETIAAFEKAIRDSGIEAPLFITQNDGTVVEAAQARRLPVYSFASGATNSMRGAAYLSGMQDAMVVDVGGTTTDVGQLKQRVSARGELGRQGRRRAHPVPHARPPVDRSRWRQPRRARSGEGRAGLGRLPAPERRHRLRWQAAHDDRRGHRLGRALAGRQVEGGASRRRDLQARSSPRPHAWPRRRSTA